MNKLSQTEAELRVQLRDQIELLTLLTNAFDKGSVVTAKQIATIVRVLVHDSDRSHSLLGQLNMKAYFFDSCTSVGEEENEEGYLCIGGFVGIAAMAIGPNPQYVPYLDETPGGAFGMVPFEEYWSRKVLIDSNGSVFTRKKIVLAVANQDGGAHVDPEIDSGYHALTRQNSMGWKASSSDGIEKDLEGVERVIIRQIGHEILRTLQPHMPQMKMPVGNNTMTIGGMGMLISKAANKIKTVVPRRIPKVGRNEKCPCGSGKKYKKCHGYN